MALATVPATARAALNAIPHATTMRLIRLPPISIACARVCSGLTIRMQTPKHPLSNGLLVAGAEVLLLHRVLTQKPSGCPPCGIQPLVPTNPKFHGQKAKNIARKVHRQETVDQIQRARLCARQ